MKLPLLTMRAAATLLAVCFFLPMRSCSGVDESVFSVYDWPSFEAMPAVFLFFWPLVTALFFYRRTFSTMRWGLVMQLTLCAATLGAIAWFVSWGDAIRYGTFVAYVAVFLYVAGLVVYFRQIKRQALTGSTASPPPP